jgi:tetratricopeptide (TPR) repeat protein
MGVRFYGRRVVVTGWLCLLCFLVLPSILSAQAPASSAPPSISYNLALQALSAQNHQEALAKIQEAISEDPSNLEYQHVLGVIYVRLQRWDEAELVFNTLVREDEEQFRKVYFDLADIHMQQKKDEQALEMAGKARPVDPGRAEYLIGAILMRLKDYRKAAESFEQAAQLKPDLAPQARTQQAVALYYLGKLREARKVLEELLRMELPPEKAEEIRGLLKSIETAAGPGKPWQVTISAGYIYDSNLFQNPIGQNAPDGGVKDEDDMGVILSAGARYAFYQKDSLKVGAAYNHYQLTYVQHHDQDLIGARPSLFLQWEESPYYLNIDYVYSHFWLGSDSFVDQNSLFPSLVVLHGDRFRTVAISGIEGLLYRDETPDTIHGFLGLTEMYMLRQGTAHVRAGYLLDYNKLIPEESGDYYSHIAMVGFQWPVWKDKWFLDVAGQYVWRDYDFDPAFSLREERRDNEQDIIVQLNGRLTSYLLLTVLVQQTWNDSNLDNDQDFDPFNYRRTVTSCVLTYNW